MNDRLNGTGNRLSFIEQSGYSMPRIGSFLSYVELILGESLALGFSAPAF